MVEVTYSCKIFELQTVKTGVKRELQLEQLLEQLMQQSVC